MWLFQKVHGTSPWSRPLGASVWGHYQKSAQIFALAEVYVITGAGTRDQNTKISKSFRDELGTIMGKLGLIESGLEELFPCQPWLGLCFSLTCKFQVFLLSSAFCCDSAHLSDISLELYKCQLETPGQALHLSVLTAEGMRQLTC